jgi:hypothetical protein
MERSIIYIYIYKYKYINYIILFYLPDVLFKTI